MTIIYVITLIKVVAFFALVLYALLWFIVEVIKSKRREKLNKYCYKGAAIGVRVVGVLMILKVLNKRSLHGYDWLTIAEDYYRSKFINRFF